jgi:hypothetical protein
MTAMATLYVGQYCLGFILSRGKSGFEAFTPTRNRSARFRRSAPRPTQSARRRGDE